MAGMTLPAGLVLKLGSTGTRVRRLQEALNDNRPTHRYRQLPLVVDGIFGLETLAAVKHFQAASGLATDGIVGPRTLTALGFTLVGEAPAYQPDESVPELEHPDLKGSYLETPSKLDDPLPSWTALAIALAAIVVFAALVLTAFG